MTLPLFIFRSTQELHSTNFLTIRMSLIVRNLVLKESILTSNFLTIPHYNSLRHKMDVITQHWLLYLELQLRLINQDWLKLDLSFFMLIKLVGYVTLVVVVKYCSNVLMFDCFWQIVKLKYRQFEVWLYCKFLWSIGHLVVITTPISWEES